MAVNQEKGSHGIEVFKQLSNVDDVSEADLTLQFGMLYN